MPESIPPPEDNCPICGDEFKDGDDAVVLECKHILHDKCYEDLTSYDKKKQFKFTTVETYENGERFSVAHNDYECEDPLPRTMEELVRKNENLDKCPVCRKVSGIATCVKVENPGASRKNPIII